MSAGPANNPDTILHEHSPPGIRWTTVNMAEVLPGVLTPLAWTFWRDPCEAGLRAAFGDTGVLPTRDVPPPARVEQRLTGLFQGRLAANLNVVCELCDHMPGTSGEAFEEQIFGRADPDVARHPSRARYAVVAAKMPVHLALLPRRLRKLRAEVDVWWRSATGPAPVDSPIARLAQAREMLRRSMRRHMLASLAAQGCYDQVTRLASTAGLPGLELSLMTGYGGMEETRISADLWEVARDRLTLDEFVGRHGFHGPNEGQLASRPWREDRRAIEDVCRTYRRMGEDENPRARERRQAETRRRAEQRLLTALPAHHRPAAKLALRAAARYLPLREVGKASFLQAIDGGRAAARQIGDELVGAGHLNDREDVFWLTLEEITAPPSDDLAERAAARRTQHAGYLRLQLPERWIGAPEPIRRGAPTDGVHGSVSGIPVSPGVAQGRARVVHDPDEITDFDPGDILVCETTDPSWVVLFQLAGAVVIDVGGAMSHGAIVARELGLPCVINTRNGTTAIAAGSRISVDGATGLVEVLDPGSDAEPAAEKPTEIRSPHAS